MRPLGTGMVTVGIIVLLNALALPATIGVSSVAVVLWIVGGALLVGGVAVRRRGKPTVKEELRLRQLEDLREKQLISGDVNWLRQGQRYLLEYTVQTPYYGIWDRNAPGPPVQKFPYNEHGKLEAEDHFARLEASAGVTAPAPEPAPSRPSRTRTGSSPLRRPGDDSGGYVIVPRAL